MSEADKSSKRVRALFGEIAPKYDFLNNLLSFGLARRWRRVLVAQTLKRVLRVWDGAGRIDILDVATGTGDVIIEIHRQWKKRSKRMMGANLATVGVDFVPEMLELAKKKVANKRIRDVEFIEADGMELPFRNHQFDAVTICFGLRNMVDPARGVAEMARVCRSGGVVAIMEFTPPTLPIFAQLFRFYFHKILPVVGQRIAKNSKNAYSYLPKSVDEFADLEKVLDYMRRAGVDSPRYYTLTFGVLRLFIGRKR
ncbi:MAG: bifunctional demethylmenaquinone methyltransferase/2-methoxy-6-polyprenyl-1,4-benzoquinol methylase UbiE [Thermoguttaceae bacterium]|jgi:demethylmenaquinone methyltransferase/2-methoxy-6-polyprenyl-1,4-benzoquinol methylase|nr:bifunctional demethylmenaquinone methyltransferase/2-methoxy-6-polyprenyl-1,4-benzoquinol methylase UbiE [Thermoguttaceae bacterium]